MLLSQHGDYTIRLFREALSMDAEGVRERFGLGGTFHFFVLSFFVFASRKE